jgi:hypothetical protein
MQLVENTHAARVANWRDMRAKARSVGDFSMVHTAGVELQRLGVGEPLETTQGPEMEQAVPEKAKRGRKPKPRCEHDMILERCPDCSPEDQVA